MYISLRNAVNEVPNWRKRLLSAAPGLTYLDNGPIGNCFMWMIVIMMVVMTMGMVVMVVVMTMGMVVI